MRLFLRYFKLFGSQQTLLICCLWSNGSGECLGNFRISYSGCREEVRVSGPTVLRTDAYWGKLRVRFDSHSGVCAELCRPGSDPTPESAGVRLAGSFIISRVLALFVSDDSGGEDSRVSGGCIELFFSGLESERQFVMSSRFCLGWQPNDLGGTRRG